MYCPKALRSPAVQIHGGSAQCARDTASINCRGFRFERSRYQRRYTTGSVFAPRGGTQKAAHV